ncbi:MAG TPA: response regulator transcription factor [Lichenihabitans sp.]|jgi:two-component system KDP operon response regulator KdpE|nr:response regulator transcription factor [Lichenihabitans sp.]
MPASETILVVDDEPQIQRFLRPALTAAGFAVAAALDGAEALRRFKAVPVPALVLLDLGLPDRDGKDVIRAIRATSRVPIVVLSARDREDEKVEALDLGADDYVNKPFGIAELMARIRTALRHGIVADGGVTRFEADGLVVDTLAHKVTLRGEPLRLTPKEFELLQFLARHAGRVITHQQILKSVWGPAHAEDAQYLRVFVRRLRQKIEADPAQPKVLRTEPGVGYRLERG